MRRTFIITMTFLSLLLSSCSKDEPEDIQPTQPQEATRWECIWFGSYPANEVVSLPSTIITRSRHSIW